MDLSRRQFIGVFSYVSGLGALAVYAWDRFEAHRGYIIEKRAILHRPDRGPEVMSINKENIDLGSNRTKFLFNKSGDIELNDSDMERLRKRYTHVGFELKIGNYDDDKKIETVVYKTYRPQFNQATPGTDVSYQTAIFDDRKLVSFSRNLSEFGIP